jgi:fructose-1,6-bisphosphatase/inositol monophosphatase family enzyme
MIRDAARLLDQLRRIHGAIRDAVVHACERSALEHLAQPLGETAGDTIFAIDRVSEAVLLHHVAALAAEWPCMLVAEGLGDDGRLMLPAGLPPDQAELIIIIDPIDGTRGLMYQKRPAWILTGVAAARPDATLADIELALMTEIPLVKQHLCDVLWASAGGGMHAERYDRLSGVVRPLRLQPSGASTPAQGYGAISRFFPGARDLLAAADDQLIEQLLGVAPPGVAVSFEDQNISTGGQLYELIAGHDRWVADVRPLADVVLRQRGRPLGLCCHPYDICTELIAREAGVVVADPWGARLMAPLDVTSAISWVGFANPVLARQMAPALRVALRGQGLL